MTHPPRPTAFSRLNDEIKDRIFQYAGREATFAYRIATGGREDSKQYIMKNAFYEPFTYWDWYNTDHTFKEADKRKRMLFRERERGYRANGKWSSYPSLKQRWEDFKKCMNAETRVLVKRIAVARWMEEQDLEWICSNLLNLEALDFSDLETRDGRMDLMDSLGQPRWRGILRVMQSTSPIPRADGEESPVHILKRLKWLGLSNDLRTEGDDAFSTLLRACENLQTLSLRAPTGYDADYWSDLHQQEAEDIHHKVCLPILRITSNAPDTVTTLELRHYLDFIPFFVDRLNSLKPSIKKVGIDLGAWVQVFPLRRAHKVDEKRIIEDEEIKENVKKAANWASEIGKLNKKTIIAEIETVEKGNSLEPLDKERDKMARKLKDELDNELLDREYTKKKRSFYRDDGGTCIHEGGTARQSRTFEATNCSLDGASHTRIHGVTNTRTTNTLPRMLKKLWTLRNKTPSLFALDPEPETRSLDPVNPLALVQMNDEVNFGAGTKYKDSGPDQDLTEVYQYLNVTFGWRPVFDWDWFMLPKHKRKIPDSAYERMLEEDKDYLARIEQQFRYLQGAGIPIHLLIGRCKEGHSSCYWQCPDSEKGWKSMVKQNYGAYLHNIAPLVDSLSIFYDLRNPEDSERLETIEALQPCKRPPAKCPQFPCPWGADPDDIYGVCPFRLQRDPLDIRRRNADDGKQKMANKAALHIHRPTDHVHLANSGAAAPPVGENASDYESEDSETDGIAHVTPLHELARTARYTCEGLGWNLFWAKNALKFTRLTMLRVRMPAPFEKTDSWRLAKLLDKKAGWELAVYTDERERVQAEENLIKTIPGVPNSTFEHLPEAKAWPGGRFVRRTWIWSEQRGHFTTDRKFGLAHLKDTDALEEQAREKALARAKSAIKRLGETEARLREEHPERVPLDSREKYRLYVHAVRLIAQEKWEAEIQERIDALQNEINRGIRDPAQSPQQEIQWLQQREREKVPIVGFEPQFDNLETGSDSIKDDIGWKDATSRSVDWIPRSWFDNLVPEYGFWEHLNAEGAGDPYQTPGTEPESYVPEEFRHNIPTGEESSPDFTHIVTVQDVMSEEMEGVEDSTVADMGGLLEVAGDNVVVYGGTTVDSPVASPEESRKRQRSVELAQHEIELETGRKRKSVAEIRTSPSKKPRTSHSARRGTIATEAPTRPSPEIQIEQAQHRELEMQLNQLHKPSVSPPLPELSSRRRRSTVSRSPQPPVAPAPQHGPEIIVIPDEPEPLATVLETEQEGQEEDEAWSVTRLSPKSSATPGIGAEVEITPPLPPVPVPTEEEFETSPEAEIQPSGRDTVPAPKSKGKAPSAKRASGRAYVPEEEQRESEEEGDKQASVRSGKISKGNASSGKRASGQAYVPEEEPHETEDEADNPASVRSDKGSKGKGKGKARGGRVTKADTATKEAKPKTERKKRDKKIVPPPEISPSDGPVARRTRSRKKL